MKKLVTLVAVLSMLFAACSTDTTIETADTAPTADATPAGTDDTAADDDAAADDDDTADDADDATSTANEPTVAAEPTAEPTADDPEPTTAPTTTESPATATAEQAAALQAVVDADDWCQAAAVVEEDTDALDTLAFGDPAALEQGLTQAIAVISASQRLAPPEIADDVAQTVTGFSALSAALADADWQFFDLDLAVIEDLGAPMELATYNIEKYNYEECGIGIDPGDPPTVDDLLDGSDEDFEFDGTIRDQAILGFVEAGFTEEQAGCLFDNIDFANPEALVDTTQLFSVFTDCGISLDQLAQLDGGLGG